MILLFYKVDVVAISCHHLPFSLHNCRHRLTALYIYLVTLTAILSFTRQVKNVTIEYAVVGTTTGIIHMGQ
jgi:hypothetical protein